MTDLRQSRYLAVYVNIAKFTLLAALTPAIVVGIADRATQLGEGADVAAITATTVSIGSLCAIAGALGLGALADVGARTVLSRWWWMLLGTGIGTVGLISLATADTRISLAMGWAAAQLGYSGAMAVLRVILAAALPAHRRRGAVVAILGGYGGIVIPLAILIIAPRSVWETTLGLAIMSCAVPLVFLATTRQGSASVSVSHETVNANQVEEEKVQSLPPWMLVTVQILGNVVLTVFLTYHPLEMAERAEGDGIPIRMSVWVIAAAVLGLISSAAVLLAKPRLLANSVHIVIFAGHLLAASLVLRALAHHVPLVMLAAALSGCAVALNSSALFAGALDTVRRRGGGRFMGVYSAAGATGQLIGPVAALAVITATAESTVLLGDPGGYNALFLLLALIPAAWALAATLISRRARPVSEFRRRARAGIEGR